MASNSGRDKPLTPYQASKLKREPRESWCGILHDSIEEAIVHTEKNLGMFRQSAQPYWGTTRYNESNVVGWQVTESKRYRLDYAPNFVQENAEAAEWSGTPHLKGTQGVHVNEENFDDPKDPGMSRVCHPTRSTVRIAETYWWKWTKRYGQPPAAG